MKRHWTTVLSIIFMLSGIVLVLYPTVSNYVQTLSYDKVIAGYDASVNDLAEEDYADLLSAAEQYNADKAARHEPIWYLSDENKSRYYSLLDVTNTGMMGYINIPSAGVTLPVYHGISNEVLQIGVGHIESTSLPVGGVPSHCVLSAHSGLPSAKLFTNIDKLQIGDIFTLQILREIYAYEVDQILVVEPNDWSSLSLEDGMDYCTLSTCTPVGINTHRLLVRGHRVPTQESEDIEVKQSVKYNSWLWLIVIEANVFAILIMLLIKRHLDKQEKA